MVLQSEALILPSLYFRFDNSTDYLDFIGEKDRTIRLQSKDFEFSETAYIEKRVLDRAYIRTKRATGFRGVPP